MKRYVTIDFLRGFAIFGVVFVHIFSDLFNQSATLGNINELPLSLILVLLTIVYVGTWGGMFVMISATGNMFSMYGLLEKGKSIRQVVGRQVVGGVILLAFSMLVEGIFQRYAFLGTLVPAWGPVDPTRIIWHAYVMTPVHCLSVCMIVNGCVQGILFRSGGAEKYRRNIIVYAVLAITVLACSQWVWDFAKAVIPGYPTARYPASLNLPGDYTVDKPLMSDPWHAFVGYFFLLLIAGSNSPLFPFLMSSFIGNIIALLLLQKTPPSQTCKRGILGGLLILITGLVVGVCVGAGFNEYLPLTNDFGDITGVSGGLRGLWIPWFLFQVSGQVVCVFALLRLVEFRGIAQPFAKHTAFIRRFGVPAFTVYAFHRFMALPVILAVSAISGIPYMLDEKSLSLEFTLLNIFLVVLFIHGILRLWERVGYLGSLEWAMGTLASTLLPSMPKAKSNVTGEEAQAGKAPWYSRGKINTAVIFYNPNWVDMKAEGDDARFAYKLAIIGLFIWPLAVVALWILKNTGSRGETSGYIPKGRKIGIIGLLIGTCLMTILSFLTLATLGISF